MNIREDIRKLRERQIRWALDKTHGNIRASSRWLGMDATTLARWMKELQLTEYAAGLRKERTWWLA
jgi:DNA-binding NtrC family response regulator